MHFICQKSEILTDFSAAFDSEEIHRVIHEELKAGSIISLKKRVKMVNSG